MNKPITITFLGTGTSQGVPVIGCDCEVCVSEDHRDRRLRCSVLITHNNKNVLIDAGPDFRYQMLRVGIRSLEAILLTHEHKDHVGGLDDVRAFNFLMKKSMPIYAESNVCDSVRHEFNYVFAEKRYPGIPQFDLIEIDTQPFKVGGLQIIPLRLFHHKLPVLGFRIGDFAYLTDLNRMEVDEMAKLNGVKVLVVDALRIEKHVSHFNLEEALEFIALVKPEQAYLTHISHGLGKAQDVDVMLPPNVKCAYDGLKISL